MGRHREFPVENDHTITPPSDGYLAALKALDEK
jgi:hypothetical protein